MANKQTPVDRMEKNNMVQHQPTAHQSSHRDVIPLPLYHSSLFCVQLYAFHVRGRLRLLLQQHLPKGPGLSKAALEWKRRRRTLRMSHYYHCLDNNCFLVPQSEAPLVSHLFVLLLSHDDASLTASLLLSESRRQPLASTESTTVSKRSFWICAGTSQTSREK